jgi:hypothetical protein
LTAAPRELTAAFTSHIRAMMGIYLPYTRDDGRSIALG